MHENWQSQIFQCYLHSFDLSLSLALNHHLLLLYSLLLDTFCPLTTCVDASEINPYPSVGTSFCSLKLPRFLLAFSAVKLVMPYVAACGLVKYCVSWWHLRAQIHDMCFARHSIQHQGTKSFLAWEFGHAGRLFAVTAGTSINCGLSPRLSRHPWLLCIHDFS